MSNADRFIARHARSIREEDRFRFHVAAPVGWINDPNGFSFFDGKIHLFYQSNPYATHWGPMHWGHVASDDFVKWTRLPVALTPGAGKGVLGCFSGSAVTHDGKHALVYTRAGLFRQVQCLATSTDGIEYVEYERNPVVDGTMLPRDSSKADFRDPKVWFEDGAFHMLVANRNASDPYAKLLLYRSSDLMKWTYVGIVLRNGEALRPKLGVMLECPDLVRFPAGDAILVSPQDIPGHRNRHGTACVVGRFDPKTGVFSDWNFEAIAEIDLGLDFYAPQTTVMPDGRVVMVAWMQSWNRRPAYASTGFAGALTFPRELSLKDGRLHQWPVRELEWYHRNPLDLTVDLPAGRDFQDPRLSGFAQDIDISFTPGPGRTGITVFCDAEGNGLSIDYDDGRVVLDRRAVAGPLLPTDETANFVTADCPLLDGKVRIRLILDRYSCEVFLADGRTTLTATAFPAPERENVWFSSDVPVAITVHKRDVVR
ncbi:MAG: GH32 C-terminal domain-containing protein [Candidatus Izemoplasmatales bacterium]